MKFIPVDKIPPAPKKKLQKFIEEFINSHTPRAEIIFAPGEYCNPHSCYSSFYKAARISGYEIRITAVGNRTFIENRALCHQRGI